MKINRGDREASNIEEKSDFVFFSFVYFGDVALDGGNRGNNCLFFLFIWCKLILDSLSYTL